MVGGGDAPVTWSNADFDDVGPGQNQLFHHLSCHHISCLTETKTAVKKRGDCVRASQSQRGSGLTMIVWEGNFSLTSFTK